MKKLIAIIFGLVVFSSTLSPVMAYTKVKSYYKSNGTYVKSYVRSNSNALKYDNYSYKSYQPAYNKSYYTTTSTYKKTPSYVTDKNYYVGKSIYNSYKY